MEIIYKSTIQYQLGPKRQGTDFRDKFLKAQDANNEQMNMDKYKMMSRVIQANDCGYYT